jgi:hypothetical protein
MYSACITELEAAGVLCRKFQKAKAMVASAEEYFINVSTGILPNVLAGWEAEIVEAESRRLTDKAAMDIMKARAAATHHNDVVPGPDGPIEREEEWIKLGLTMQEKQYVVPTHY